MKKMGSIGSIVAKTKKNATNEDDTNLAKRKKERERELISARIAIIGTKSIEGLRTYNDFLVEKFSRSNNVNICCKIYICNWWTLPRATDRFCTNYGSTRRRLGRFLRFDAI